MAVSSIEAREPGRMTRLGHTCCTNSARYCRRLSSSSSASTSFFFIGFNRVLFTKRLILEDYLIQFAGFFIATTAALVVGKVVLVADKMPFLRRFDHAPLVRPILLKAVIYTLLVAAARLIEAFVHYVLEGGAVGRGIEHQLGNFSPGRI
jgi:hypothetical protein